MLEVLLFLVGVAAYLLIAVIFASMINSAIAVSRGTNSPPQKLELGPGIVWPVVLIVIGGYIIWIEVNKFLVQPSIRLGEKLGVMLERRYPD